MDRRKLLVATTNKGKLEEICEVLETLPFTIVSLADFSGIPEPKEDGDTLEENAMIKARYYAEKTGLLTVCDDTGFFIDELEGWPGVHAAYAAPTDTEKIALVLDRMKDIPDDKRGAEFRSVHCLYDPVEKSAYMATGIKRGTVTHAPVGTLRGLGYSPIFFVSDFQKTYAELTVSERNSVSHRGQAAQRIKYHLQNTYCGKHIVVPFGLIVKDDKVFMQLRNDPHRPEYHKKWEFPGGGMEMGETLEGNVCREIFEETGFKVEVVKQLDYVGVETHIAPTFQYQVYLIPFVCKIVGGDGVHRDEEVLETGWFNAEEVFEHDLLGDNVKIYRKILPELNEIIKDLKD